MTKLLRGILPKMGPRVPNPEPAVVSVQTQTDPFAHHPMSCKCYFHR